MASTKVEEAIATVKVAHTALREANAAFRDAQAIADEAKLAQLNAYAEVMRVDDLLMKAVTDDD